MDTYYRSIVELLRTSLPSVALGQREELAQRLFAEAISKCENHVFTDTITSFESVNRSLVQAPLLSSFCDPKSASSRGFAGIDLLVNYRSRSIALATGMVRLAT